MIGIPEVLDAVSRNPWTVLMLSPEGEVLEAVPVSGQLTPRELLELASKKSRGRRFRLVQQAVLSAPELLSLLHHPAEVLEPAEVLATGSPESSATRALPGVRSRFHPFAPVRAMAEALGKWLSR